MAQKDVRVDHPKFTLGEDGELNLIQIDSDLLAWVDDPEDSIQLGSFEAQYFPAGTPSWVLDALSGAHLDVWEALKSIGQEDDDFIYVDEINIYEQARGHWFGLYMMQAFLGLSLTIFPHQKIITIPHNLVSEEAKAKSSGVMRRYWGAAGFIPLLKADVSNVCVLDRGGKRAQELHGRSFNTSITLPEEKIAELRKGSR